MDLKLLAQGYDGLLAIGDLHGDIEALMKAYNYARKHKLFLVSLGDLVDRGPFPFETVKTIVEIVDQGHGAFVIGNHDDKHYRHALGNKVTLSGDAQRTLHSVGEDRMEEFFDLYKKLYHHTNSSYYHYCDGWIFVHGASHPDLWSYPEKLGDGAKSRALYGEVTGKRDGAGMPERIYTWIDEIPEGQAVIVGHDRKAVYNIKLVTPLMVANENSGLAIFVDTSCGKGGLLSGVVLKFGAYRTEFETFINFE
ncbi:MAG: hypothetical protein C5B52_08300 [Bacteroidetes bacterium]|nr:MAG: hypothetical protein C5B52_08300 [Bacteroidota bacterium]